MIVSAIAAVTVVLTVLFFASFETEAPLLPHESRGRWAHGED